MDAGVAEEERSDEVFVGPGLGWYVRARCVDLAIPIADGDGIREIQLVIGMRGRRRRRRGQDGERRTIPRTETKLSTFCSVMCCTRGPTAVSGLSSVVSVICPTGRCHSIGIAA